MTEQTQSTAPEAAPFCMAEFITTFLANAGHPKPDSWLTMNTGVPVLLLRDKNPSTQQRWMNRHWLQILLSADDAEKTRGARGCLIDNCDIQDYVSLFRRFVIPCAMELKLLPES